MGVISVLDRTAGDVSVTWDQNSPDEIEQAQATFDSLRKKGHMAYTVDKHGKKGTMITKFDPKAEKIIMAPPLKGG